MPSGEVHYEAFKRGYRHSIPVSVVSALWDWKYGLGYFVGYSLHRYVDNDWDIMGSNNAEGRMVRELKFIGIILYGVSSSYGAMFRKYHRSWITHLPFISTLVRLIWLLIIPFGYLDAYGINFIGDGWHMFWIGLWMGLSHADAIHWMLDKKGE